MKNRNKKKYSLFQFRNIDSLCNISKNHIIALFRMVIIRCNMQINEEKNTI